MPECHHCDATFEEDEELAAHLTSAHEWEELGRIDRKRIEVRLPEEVPQEEAELQLDTTDLDALWNGSLLWMLSQEHLRNTNG